jgi:hypothetical protein
MHKQRHVGVFMKRGFKQIDGQQYLVNVYRKAGKRVDSWIFTYEVINYDRRERTQNHMKGYYNWDPTMMMNIG